MSSHDHNLPDILRPTELADFGDVFGVARRSSQKALLIILTLAAPLTARLNALTAEAAFRTASNPRTASKP